MTEDPTIVEQGPSAPGAAPTFPAGDPIVPAPAADATPQSTPTAPAAVGTVTDQGQGATAASSDADVTATGTPITAPPAPAPAADTTLPQPTTAPAPVVSPPPPAPGTAPIVNQPALDAGQAQSLPAQVAALQGAPNIDVNALLDQLQAVGIDLRNINQGQPSVTEQMQRDRMENAPRCERCTSTQLSLHMGDATTPQFDGQVFSWCLDCGNMQEYKAPEATSPA